MQEKPVLAKIEYLKKWCLAVTEKVGLPSSEAEILVDALLSANLRGIDTHGINYLPIYIKRMEMGLIEKTGKIRKIKDGPCYALLDAGNTLGQNASLQAINLAIEKAKAFGVGVVGIKNSNHCGALSYYTMLAPKADCIGMGFTNSVPTMAPWGGAEGFLGTNPISIALPYGKNDSMVLDIATSVQARAKVVLAASKEEKIPIGWALDVNGNPTDDPQTALKGTILPMAGHKGYGLALTIDILSGVLTGAASAREVGAFLFSDGAKKQNVGHLFQAIKIENFVPIVEFRSRVKKLVNEIRSSSLAPGFEKIRIPGDVEREHEIKRLEEGIPLRKKVYQELSELGKKYGVELNLGNCDNP